MRLTLDKIGALAFLAFAITYGSLINDIPLFPGDEDLPFNARTMPKVLAWLMAIVAFLMLVLPTDSENKKSENKKSSARQIFTGLNWRRTLSLIGLMVFYGLTLPFLGFILATIVFLIGSIRLMGEKRWSIILISAIPLTILFWGLLDQVLGIFLSPGDIFYWIKDIL